MHEKPEVIDESFMEEYGEGKGMSRTERMNKRNEIAKQLITTTYKAMTTELEQCAKENHEQEVKEQSLGLEMIEEAEDVHLYVYSDVCQLSPANTIL
jgi:hypothetical protein